MQTDFVITTLQNWDIGIGSNIINLAAEFSKKHRVLFINYALDRYTLIRRSNPPLIRAWKEVRKEPGKALRKVRENLWVFTPGYLLEPVANVKPMALASLLNRINAGRIAAGISKAIRQIGMKDYILFADNDLFRSLHLKELLHPSRFIYYIRDYTITTPYGRNFGAKAEKEIIRKADFVLANSAYLAAYAAGFNKAAYDIGQGCDLGLYNPETAKNAPADFPALSGPVIGYTGTILGLRLDEKLLLHIARSKPNWNLLLVGPEDDVFRKSVLHQMTNVFFTGQRKQEELPAWIARFDVAINPQTLNDVTIGNYPRKIDEYLAMGVPVVATRTPAMELFKDHVYLANDYDDFINGINASLTLHDEAGKQSRISFAAGHSWTAHVGKILEILKINS